MSTRTISLSEDAYQALKALKGADESFSDVVRRLTRRRSLTDLCEALDPDAAEQVADAVEASSQERIDRRKEELDLS